MRLGRELNKTYLEYGSAGREKKERQKQQDKNAAAMSRGALVQRSVAKSSSQYVNSDWDLLDAVESESVDLFILRDNELPYKMKGMDENERKVYVTEMLRKREKIRKKINTLNRERRKYVENEMKKRAGQNTLDAAIIKTIRKQAKDKNFRFE